MNRKLTLSLALTLLAFSSLITASISFAWILTSYPFANMDNKPGEIDGIVTSRIWKNSNWETFTSATPPSQIMGEMDRIDELPPNHTAYYLFHFTEEEDVNVEYHLLMEEIEIVINSIYLTNPDDVKDVSYYIDEPSQSAYYYNAIISPTNSLNPVTLFSSSGAGTQINSKNQMISPRNLVPNDEYLYVMFYLGLVEVQNIIDNIPLAISPYTLGFDFTFNIEKRTVDEY